MGRRKPGYCEEKRTSISLCMHPDTLFRMQRFIGFHSRSDFVEDAILLKLEALEELYAEDLAEEFAKEFAKELAEEITSTPVEDLCSLHPGSMS